ncbi:MAG: hypothetical protein KAY37_01135 [Phycisphaerae bacterium]|nr:hypothetical protein [Phycisphaerae bacterium]
MLTLRDRHLGALHIALPFVLAAFVAVFGWHTGEAIAGPPAALEHFASTPADPSATPIMIVFNPFAEALDDPFSLFAESGGPLIAHDEAEFETLLGQYEFDPRFMGTVVVTDGVISPQWPPSDFGDAHVRLTIFDQATLDEWEQTQYTPGFLQDPPRIIDEVPEIGEAVFDMELWQREGHASMGYYHMRVRAPDGAIALVSAEHETQVVANQLVGGDKMITRAGPWWWLCCLSQFVICETIHQILPFLPLNCYSDCWWACRWGGVSNPCHSCDPWGLSLVLRYFVPGGH